MPAVQEPMATRLVLLLAAGAGAVDAMVILGFQVLTAAQTGNTILLAVALARGEWSTGLDSGVSVGGFVLGALGGAWLLLRSGWGVARALTAELAVLAAATILWSVWGGRFAGVSTPVVGAVAFAMGLQSAVMLHLRASSTTYVTGVLAAFARNLAGPPLAESSPSRPAWFEGGVWVVYLAGAIAGSWLFLRHGAVMMLVPLLAIGAAALLAARAAADD
jgi:uncharacterized membrane protein YoaK (UPF0700 family)